MRLGVDHSKSILCMYLQFESISTRGHLILHITPLCLLSVSSQTNLILPHRGVKQMHLVAERNYKIKPGRVDKTQDTRAKRVGRSGKNKWSVLVT